MFKLDFFKSKFVYLICLLFFSNLNHAQKTLRIGYVNMDYILENIIANNDYLMIKGSNATGLNIISKAMIKGI